MQHLPRLGKNIRKGITKSGIVALSTVVFVTLGGLVLSIAPAQAADCAPNSIWGDTVTPSNPSADFDSQSVEIGTRFVPSQDGQVSAIKFYKGTGNGGTHIGSLWSSDGTLLSRATFANETGSGWQTADLSTPVSVTAGTAYVVSYHAPQGHYAYAYHVLDSAITNGLLTAPADTANAPNGAHVYGSDPAFPNTPYQASAYYVDVAYTPASCIPHSLWDSTVTPSNPSADFDSQSVEIGTRFVPSQNGQVSAIKFYKGTGNDGTHTGSLWSADGTLLGRVTFANETASGWQTATLSTPVSVTAGTAYVVSYHAPQGHYAYSYHALDSAITNGLLTAPANTAGAPNGAYVYGSDPAFPNASYQASAYYVDVVYTTA